MSPGTMGGRGCTFWGKGEWWYCLQREPTDSTLVRAMDTSNRSIVWNWEAGQGSWTVRYTHSFNSGPNGELNSRVDSRNCVEYSKEGGAYTMDACYKTFSGPQTCFGYNPSTGWSGSPTPINARAWDMSYNGDRFGFRPSQPDGRYTAHIYTRNLQFDPWATSAPVIQEPVCIETSIPRTEGNGWWLERKSTRKCPVTTNQAELSSPAEWSWDSGAGRWIVRYAWNREQSNCTVSLVTEGKTAQLMEWQYLRPQLLLTYSGSPVRVYKDAGWTLMVVDGETWGFQPKEDGTWLFPVYSRNVIIRPFEHAQGSFNLQQ